VADVVKYNSNTGLKVVVIKMPEGIKIFPSYNLCSRNIFALLRC